MWTIIARFILRNRLFILITIGLITLFMGYQASKIELSYELSRVLPLEDQAHKDYTQFKALFGEDGNVLVIGFQDKRIFDRKVYNSWYQLGNDINGIDGIKEVLSVGRFYDVKPDSLHTGLHFKRLPDGKMASDEDLAAIEKLVYSTPFYKGVLINDSNATLMAVTFERTNLNSSHRIAIVNKIKKFGAQFTAGNNIQLHYSGMPYIRTEFMSKVSQEMKLFLLLAFFVTTSILFIFFRRHLAVFFSSIVVLVGVIWSLGTIQLLGYKITILSGLIPPLVMIIGVPNCIFLINKYQTELRSHGNQAKSLTRIVERIGISLLLANITTAIGFGVFYFTNSDLLKEFGVVAAINITATYIVSLVFIPIAFSYFPMTDLSRTEYFHSVRISRLLNSIDYIVHYHRKQVYIGITLLTAVSLYGISKATVKGYLVDDLPSNHPVYSDLRFFEKNFKGVLPFEIIIDTKKENGLYANSALALYKMNFLQKKFAAYPELSKPLSITEVIKFLNQGYNGGDQKYYRFPAALQLKELADNMSSSSSDSLGANAFTDRTNRIGRISYKIADVGSIRMKELVTELKMRTDSLFKDTDYKVSFTGYSLVFLKSNDYLLNNLFESLLIAILLITLVGLALFRSLRVIILSKIPCLIPLIFTAGIMGFFNIYFKPSTILIFSIAFGIASDGTIYFLTRYRYELMVTGNNSQAISLTIRETGVSMIYTAIILFFGFGIFIFSGFGGTVALGILISTTILMAAITNLILLPCFLLSIGKHLKLEKLKTNSALHEIH